MSVLHMSFPVKDLRREWDETDVIYGGLKPICAWDRCHMPLRRKEIHEGVHTALYIRCTGCEWMKKWSFEELGECQTTLCVEVLLCKDCLTELWHNTETDEWECVFCD